MNQSQNKYKIVVATQKNKEEFEKTPIKLSIDKLGWSSKLIVITENKQGLSEVYNQFLTEEYAQYKILFVHDDVLIEDLFFDEKLELAFQKYDIVGLAGSKKCNLTAEMPAWHLMCQREDMVGEVSHSKDKNYWTTCFGPTDSRALILDGVFLGINVESLLKTNTKFDENFKFHHYDITFCLTANKNKLKMGVYPLKITHFGLGDSMNTTDWQQSAAKFKELYAKAI